VENFQEKFVFESPSIGELTFVTGLAGEEIGAAVGGGVCGSTNPLTVGELELESTAMPGSPNIGSPAPNGPSKLGNPGIAVDSNSNSPTVRGFVDPHTPPPTAAPISSPANPVTKVNSPILGLSNTNFSWKFSTS
jgi:hypothetical protein